jgi:Fur family ferric uptake transcriptional regulator
MATASEETGDRRSAAFRAAGLRATRPRRVLLRVLAEADGPLAADELLRRARCYDRTVSLATVYRFLAVLRRIGIEGCGTPARPESPEHVALGRIVRDDVRFQLRATLGDVLRRFGYRLVGGSIDLEVERLPASPRAAGPL